jgi:hypothetical protein
MPLPEEDLDRHRASEQTLVFRVSRAGELPSLIQHGPWRKPQALPRFVDLHSAANDSELEASWVDAVCVCG